MIQLFKKLYIGIKFMLLMNALGDQKCNSTVINFFLAQLSIHTLCLLKKKKMDLGPLSMFPL